MQRRTINQAVGDLFPAAQPTKEVTMRDRIITILVALVAATMFLSISTTAAQARGECGAQASSWAGYYKGLQKKGVVDQAAKINESAGYRPVDGSFKSWLQERVVVARLAQATVIDNYGCNPGQVFSAGKKTLTKGWPVLIALPSQYDKSDIATKKPSKGSWKRVKVRVALVGQATCINPGKARVYVYLWIRQVPKGKTSIRIKKRTEGSSSGTFSFSVKKGKSKAKTYKVKAGQTRSLGYVKRGTKIEITETNIPSGWSVKGSKTQKKTAKSSRLTFTFTNVKVKIPDTSKPRPGCELGTHWSDTQQACIINEQTQNVKQNCDAGTIWNGAQCVVIQVNCGTVVVGNGNTVNSDNCSNKEQNICTANGGSWHNNVCMMPPPPPPPPPVTPEEWVPGIELLKPAHLMVGGEGYVYARAFGKSGYQLAVNINVTGAASNGASHTVDQYFDGALNGGRGAWVPCSAGWTCYRTKVFAGATVGTATATGTATAGNKTTTTTITFPVEPDKGF